MASRPLIVVCGIIFQGKKLLATRRDPKRHFPLLWEFPGGKLEPEESPEEALHRELLEELSLKVKIIKALDVVRFQKDAFHMELLPFLCKVDQPHGVIPHDHVEVRWILPGDAPELDWAPADVPLLSKLEELSGSLRD